MFSLIRRISGSVLPRADRPWDDDATSNAPQIGKKRKLSLDSINEDQPAANKKSRPMDEVHSPSVVDEAEKSIEIEPESSPSSTQPVKEVTSGVANVDLTDPDALNNIPLPTQDDAEVEALKAVAPEASGSSAGDDSSVHSDDSSIEEMPETAPKQVSIPLESAEGATLPNGHSTTHDNDPTEEPATAQEIGSAATVSTKKLDSRPTKPLPTKGRKNPPPSESTE